MRALAIILAATYWFSAAVAAGAAWLSTGASERPEMADELTAIAALTVVALLMATVVAFGVATARDHWVLVGVWALEACVLAFAMLVVISTDAARVAPPFSGFVMAGIASGLLAITLNSLYARRTRT